MRYLIITVLSFALISNLYANDKIDKALRGTIYSAKPCTEQYAKNNYKGNSLNCIQYCHRIKSVCPDSKIYIVKQGKKIHAFIDVYDKGKVTTYSNGKLVKSGKYTRNK